MSRQLPIFPLGTVVFPASALPIHIFEPRYQVLMADLLPGEFLHDLGEDRPAGADRPPELGVVGIERGQEVGGGEVRHQVGTVVRLIQPQQLDGGRWFTLFAGHHRFRVDEWLPDDPYPVALVTDVDEAPWEPTDGPGLAAVQRRVGEVLALAVEVGDLAGPTPALTWADDPAMAAWQACAVSPIGTFDHQRLLEADTVATRLALLATALDGAAEVFAFRLGGR
jgi:uncharacterized protein